MESMKAMTMNQVPTTDLETQIEITWIVPTSNLETSSLKQEPWQMQSCLR